MIVRPLAPLFPARVARRRSAPPRRHRGARRALLWGAAGFVLAQLGFAAAVETVLPQVRDPEYGYRQFRATGLQGAHPDRPLVIVIGTSRAQNAVDPSAMGFPDEAGSPLVFNAGLSGTRPVHLPLNLRRFRAAGVRPAAVLVELFPATLVVSGPADYLFADLEQQLTAADLKNLEPYLADPAALRRRWALGRANSLHALRPVVLAYLAPKWRSWQHIDYLREHTRPDGFLPYPFETVTDEYRARKRAETAKTYAAVNGNLFVSPLSDRAYRDLVADCRAAGIPVAFFLTPESPVFRGWYTPEARAAVAAFSRVLSDDLGAPVFDAPTDYGEDDFADGHHMLPPAARRFSRELADRHIGPWLASVRPPAGERR